MTALIVNRKAAFDYEILQMYEAGLQLFGHEAKSLQHGHGNLAGAFVVIRNNEVFLTNATISPYQPKNTPADYDPTRSRKLLLHRNEIKELVGATSQKGLTLIPIRLYNKKSKIKLEFALARRKKKRDQREAIRKREDLRAAHRTLRGE